MSLWKWAIGYEMDRTSRNVYHLDLLFERCLELDHMRSDSDIWKLYIELHVEYDLKKAKMLFYRAIRECVWDKSVYLLAFRSGLRNAFEEDELREIITLMEEKDMRIYQAQ